MQLPSIQEPEAGCGCGCIPELLSTSLPSSFRKKHFWRKTCACQSPSSSQRAGSCLTCPSLRREPLEWPGRGILGCSVPRLPPEPILPQVLCLRAGVPPPRGSCWPVWPSGEHPWGLLALVRTQTPPCSPHSPSLGRSPAPMSCTRPCCCARMNAYKILKLFLRQFMITSPLPQTTLAHPHHPFCPPPPLPAPLELPGMPGSRYVTQVSNRMRFTEGLSPSGSLLARRRPREEPKSGRAGSSRSLLPS